MFRFLTLLLLLGAALAENSIQLLDESDVELFRAEWDVKDVEWRMFRTADDHVIAELSTTMTKNSVRGALARYVEARAYDGPAFETIDVTDCLSESPSNGCLQHWYLRSTDVLAPSVDTVTGHMSVMVETEEYVERLFTLRYEFHVEFDGVHDAQSILVVDNKPYIGAVADTNGSTVEGQEMCVTMRNRFSFTPLSAMLCSSSRGELRAEDGCDAADTTFDLFDAYLDKQLEDAFIEIRHSPSDPNAVQLCYNDVKIGEYNQLVQVMYEEDAEEGAIARRGTTTIEPQGGSFGHGYSSSCRSGWFWDTWNRRCHSTGPAWWVVPCVVIVLVVLCALGLFCVSSCVTSDSYYNEPQDIHPMTAGHGPRQTSQQGQQQSSRPQVIVLNRNTHTYDDADRYFNYEDNDEYYHNE